jgi:hypothetical protein
MAGPRESTTGSAMARQRGFSLRHPASRKWSTACIVCLIFMALVAALAVDFLLPDARDLPFIRDNLPIADSELHQNHVRLVFISRAAIVVGAVTATTWLAWQYLAHSNAQALSGRKGRLLPALGLVSWFLPGLNLVLPPVVMWDLLRASDPDSVSSEKRRRDPYVLLVALWWIGWLAGLLLLYIGFRPILDGHPTPSELITRDRFAIAAGLVAIPTAALAAILMALVNGRQLLKEDRLLYRDWVGWSKTA